MEAAIDCRGLSCPAPVLAAKKEIEKRNPGRITIVVDNEASGQNVSRFLETKHYRVSVQKEDGVITIVGTIETAHEPAEKPRLEKAGRKIVVLITSDTMGRGDDELGTALMGNFMKTLKELGNELWRLVFLNSGIKLAAEGSTVLETLIELENDGVTILVCGTCLTHFGLLDHKKAGQTTNMLDIVTALQAADSVITL
ncbi:MAG TPA: sulfurtransferase-like selenium metabolism protein YedF [Desulfobacteraceae bacterium]|nr:sulfurtransferase-like selenium metabolism protein YedF [Desulfobacteraceae bacterium]